MAPWITSMLLYVSPGSMDDNQVDRSIMVPWMTIMV